MSRRVASYGRVGCTVGTAFVRETGRRHETGATWVVTRPARSGRCLQPAGTSLQPPERDIVGGWGSAVDEFNRATRATLATTLVVAASFGLNARTFCSGGGGVDARGDG